MARSLMALLLLVSLPVLCMAQNDTIPLPKKQSKGDIYKPDSASRRQHDPRKATMMSTFVPGLGQVYNRKYWKVPIVWAAVGIPAYTFFDNRAWYGKCRFALYILDAWEAADMPVPDSMLQKIDPKLRNFVINGDDNSLRSYRNEYRKNEDYSVLFFLLFWGLNIVDATVDAHLMAFDVSPQLSMRLQQPSGITAGGPMGPGMGLSLVIDFHRPHYRTYKNL